MEQKVYFKKQRLYTVGYLLAAALTLFVYSVAVSHTWSTAVLAAVALGAAVLQLLVQTVFFLHLKYKRRGAWKVYSYIFTLVMLIIVVFGSLWVMMNLDYRMGMSPDQMMQKIEKENAKGF